MNNFIKKLFTRENEIDVDFKGWTLKEMLFNIEEKPKWRNEEMYINSTFGENHAVLTSATDASFKLYHNLTYYPKENKIHIRSHLAKTAWLLFALPVCMLGVDIFQEGTAGLPNSLFIPLGLSVLIAIGLQIKLYSDAKDTEREVIIRINYKLRNHGAKR
jgi:hypothetical protein